MAPARFTRRLGTFSVAAVCVGCAGTLEDPSRFAPDAGDDADGGIIATDSGCPDIPNDIFATICASAGCHSTADKIQGLDLQSPGQASRLVGVTAMGGGILVDPCNPDQSVIYTKLSLTPPFGARMPLGKMPLDDATLACVLSWIASQMVSGGSCDGGASDSGAVDGPGSDGGG